MANSMDSSQPLRQSRDSINDVWGPRTPYKHQWPTRVDELIIEEPEKWVQSACLMCSNGCGMDIGVKDGKLVGVRGRATDRVNHGRLGPKGLHAWTSLHSEDRLKYPMIRKNGKHERATWEEAMNLIVQKAQNISKRLTGHGIGFYTSGQLFLEEYYALALVGKGGLCTLHMDGNTRLCTATAAAAMRESFGSDGQPGSYTDIDYTDCIFMVGHNMSATQTVLWSRILDRLEGPNPPKLIVIDPRLSNSAKKATLHLAPKIGTNLSLLNGIQHLLLRNNWINEDYLEKHVVGLQGLRDTVKLDTSARVSQITGVPAEQIEEAARIIGHSPSLFSTVLQGVYQSNQATASACAVNNINLLKGAYGKPGSGVLQMNGQPTAQNNRESGCDGEFPGFRNYNNPNHMRDLADVWGIDYVKMPHWNQPTHVENMLNYIAQGSMEMFWISGTNPLVSLPNLPRVRELLTSESLFVVAQDIFPTETTAIADVILPAAAWGEKTGCFTNVDRTVHLSHKAIDPPGEAKSDLEIFVDFSNRMDFTNKNGEPLIPWITAEDGFEAFKKMTNGRPCDYTGLTYAKLSEGSGIQWPCNEDYPNGRERLFEDGVFFTDTEYCESFGHDLETGAPISKSEYESINPNGKAILKHCHYIPAYEMPNEEFPIALSTGRLTKQFHTRTKTGRSKPLQKSAPEPLITISEHDAKEAGIKDNEEVIVRSPRGVVQLKAKVAEDGIAPGNAFIPFHFGYWDSKDDRARAANELTTDAWDPVSKQPMFKGGAIRLEKCEPGIVHIKQQQSAAIKHANTVKPQALAIEEDIKRVPHLNNWLDATQSSLELFAKTCRTVIPKLTHDIEVLSGLRILERIIDGVVHDLKPYVQKYPTDSRHGSEVTNALEQATFPIHDDDTSSMGAAYTTLATLHTMLIYLANTSGHLKALGPSAMALWDGDFEQAIQRASSSVSRCEKWIQHQITVRAPQTLVVPARVEGKAKAKAKEEDEDEEEQGSSESSEASESSEDK